MHAVGRIAYAGAIDNIQVSWVKTGVGGARQALQAGCNDLGGTLMDENISRAAGASHGQEADDASSARSSSRSAARSSSARRSTAARPPSAAGCARSTTTASRPRRRRSSAAAVPVELRTREPVAK